MEIGIKRIGIIYRRRSGFRYLVGKRGGGGIHMMKRTYLMYFKPHKDLLRHFVG